MVANAAEDQTRLPAPDAAQLAFGLFRDKAVVNELKLTMAQVEEVKAIEEHVRARGQGVSFNERVALFRDAGSKLAHVLNDEQRTRLRQITIQGFGPAAFRMEEIANQIGLTKGQAEQIHKELDEWRNKRRRLSRVARGEKPPPNVLAAIRELREAANKKVFGILTDKQRAAYDDLVGPRFAFSRDE